MTGSLNVSGSLTLNDGTLTVTDNVDFNGDLDVDGTSNLDVVDIDGAVDMASKLVVAGQITGSSTTLLGGNVSISSQGNGLSLSRSGYDTYALQHSTGNGMAIFNVSDDRNEMHFKGDGNVGIGTSSPLAKLHVEHTTDDTDENGNIGLTVGGGASGNVRHYFGINNSSNYAYYGAVEHATQYVPLVLQPNGSVVGIGSTSPGANLDVGHATDPRIRMTRTDSGVTSDEVLGSLQFAADDPSAGAVGASIQAKASSAWSSNNYGAYIRFLTTPDDSGDQAERVRITEDGQLHVSSSIRSVGDLTGKIEIYSDDYMIGRIVPAGSSAEGRDAGYFSVKYGGTDTIIADAYGYLQIDDQGRDRKNIEIKSTGDVAHGMTAYDDTNTYFKVSKASTQGGAQIVGYSGRGIGVEMVCRYNGDEDSSYDSSGQSTSVQAPINIVVQKANGTSVQAVPADKNMLSIRSHTTTRFIFNSNGTAYAGDSWTTISDKRVKKDIKDIPYGLDEINKLEPKIFTRYDGDFDDEGNVVLDGDGKKQIGFIAQEIKEVVPEMIANQNQDLTEGFYVMDDGKLTSVLVKAVQELSQKNEALEKRIEELEK